MTNLGAHPTPTAPWRPLIFRVHCIVTMRWMKIRVPFAWFWFGEGEYGTPEVESGMIADPTPKPPVIQGPRMPAGEPPPVAAPVRTVEDIESRYDEEEDGYRRARDPLPTPAPYMTPRHTAQHQEGLAERLDRLERELQAAREGRDPNWRGRTEGYPR